jgi:hypothetical protein
MQEGGYEALLYELKNENLDDFCIQKLPANTEAFDVKMLSASTSEQYIYEALCEGAFDLGNGKTVGNAWDAKMWGSRSVAKIIYSDYTTWCSNQKKVQDTSEIFGTKLRKTIPSTKKIRAREGDARVNTYEFPELKVARKEFEKSWKVGPEVWD